MKARLLAVLTLILLLSILPAPRIADAQPSQGNWTISDNELIQNKTITLNSNLTVTSGGNLTLNGATLTMNNDLPGRAREKSDAVMILFYAWTASALASLIKCSCKMVLPLSSG